MANRFHVKRQRGMFQIYAILAIAVLGMAASGVFLYTHAIKRAEQAEEALRNEQAARIAAETRLENVEAIEAQKRALYEATQNAQIENRARAAERKATANASQVSKTSQRDAKKYEGFVRRVLPKNLKTLNCKSNLRNLDDENACPSHIR